MIFSASTKKITVIFDKDTYVYGVDSIVSGYIEGLDEEDIDIFIETKYGVSEKNYNIFPDKPSHYFSIESSKIKLTKELGYRFELPLEFPNINAGEDAMGMGTFTYICNFLILKSIVTRIPISIEELDECRRLSKENLEVLYTEIENTKDEQRYELGGNSNLSEFFKKRVLDNTIEPGIMRLPWNLGDAINTDYYYSIINSSVFYKIAHFIYLYNIHLYIYFLGFVYGPFLLIYLIESSLRLNIYTIIGLILLISVITVTIIQGFLKKKMYPSQFFLRLKNKETIDGIFDSNIIVLANILEEQNQTQNNILTGTSGKVKFSIYVYYSFMYGSGKTSYTHIEYLYFKKNIEKRFSSHSEILSLKTDIQDISLIKNRKKLEEIGIFTGFSLSIEYDQFPDKVYEYNLDQYIS